MLLSLPYVFFGVWVFDDGLCWGAEVFFAVAEPVLLPPRDVLLPPLVIVGAWLLNIPIPSRNVTVVHLVT